MKLKDNPKVKFYSPAERLNDDKFIAEAIWDCLKDNDPEGVIEILKGHILAKNISKLNVPRTTIYRTLSSKNPTLRSLAKIVNSI